VGFEVEVAAGAGLAAGGAMMGWLAGDVKGRRRRDGGWKLKGIREVERNEEKEETTDRYYFRIYLSRNVTLAGSGYPLGSRVGSI